MDCKNLFYLLLARYVTYIVVFITSIVLMDRNFIAIMIYIFLFILFLVNSSIRIIKLEDKPLIFMASALIEIPIIILMQYKFHSINLIYLYIIVVDVFLMLRLSYALFMSILIFFTIILSSLLDGGYVDLITFLNSFTEDIAIMIFIAGATYIIKMELKGRIEMQCLYEELKKSKDELEEANKKINEYAMKVEDTTILNERNRLAGEIHDTIGHNMTALIMVIDICNKLVDKDIDKTKVELRKVSEIARNTLSEVRRSVRAIKPSSMEKLTGILAVEEMIKDFEKNTRISIEFYISRQQYKLSPTHEVTIYRTIQEALTNCAKYGQTDIVMINLCFQKCGVELMIKDNGKGCRKLIKGIGLNTMEDRIYSLGGNIEISNDNGFTIKAFIPVEVT